MTYNRSSKILVDPNKICSMCCSTKDSEIDHFAEGMVRKKKKMKLLTAGCGISHYYTGQKIIWKKK